MKAHAARQAHHAIDRFLFEASLLAGELDTLRRIDNPEQRRFAVLRGQEAYEELLRGSEFLLASGEDRPLVQSMLERIRIRLKNLS